MLIICSISKDPSGAWLVDQPVHTTFDQTAEIAIFLQEIGAKLPTLQQGGIDQG